MDYYIDLANRIVWSDALIILCLGTGLYFTFKTRFVQIRYIKEMIHLLFTEGSSKKGLSPFQAFSIAIAGRVGVGNIVGVATAIAMGGPGAIFWMWVIAFFGSASAFVESTLAQIYKEDKGGEYRGGPAFYIQKGLGKRWFALVFAIVTIVSCSLFLPGIQSNSIAISMKETFDIPVQYSAIAICTMLAITVFGGAKKIGRIAQVVVPVMATLYILMAVVIICLNIELVPSVFSLILKSAFNLEAAFSGVFGMAIAWGVKRGIYSNEAGQGSAPHAAAAAATSHPIKQGLVQSFSVYVDTFFVCTSTAIMILFTNQYNVTNPEGGFIVQNLDVNAEVSTFTAKAVSTQFPSFGNEFISIAIMFFAFTTAMAYCFISESNFDFLSKKRNKILLWLLRLVIITSVYLGSINEPGTVWSIGDIGVGLMAWVNIIAILLLQKPVFIAFKDYIKQRKEGKDPIFDPEKLGIKNTTVWNRKQH